MTSDNLFGADNQQERPSSSSWLANLPEDLGHYLAGFADGEGSFNVAFRPRGDYRNPWKVTVTFNVSQRDVTILEIFRSTFEGGNLWQRKDGVWYYETRSLPVVLERVIPFFRRFQIRSGRAKDFDIFCKVADMMSKGMHLNKDGLKEIVKLRAPMNRGGKRRYPDQLILDSLDLKESSETIRQAR